LLSLKGNEIGKLKKILAGKFAIREISRAEVRLNGKLIKEKAINDVYVGSANQFHTSRYVVKFKGLEEEHRSSGVLIATSLGSTAWYKSAGGLPFSDKNKLKVLVREPYSGKIFKPKLVHSELNAGEKIELESKRHGGGILALDSNSLHDFNFGDVAEVNLSDCPLKVVIPEHC
jgi:NAD kinase